jgi:hypothetical protein
MNKIQQNEDVEDSLERVLSSVLGTVELSEADKKSLYYTDFELVKEFAEYLEEDKVIRNINDHIGKLNTPKQDKIIIQDGQATHITRIALVLARNHDLFDGGNKSELTCQSLLESGVPSHVIVEQFRTIHSSESSIPSYIADMNSSVAPSPKQPVLNSKQPVLNSKQPRWKF